MHECIYICVSNIDPFMHRYSNIYAFREQMSIYLYINIIEPPPSIDTVTLIPICNSLYAYTSIDAN